MATPPRKIIISCAVTGSVHTPSMSDWLPITGAEIAEQSVAAAKAGAAILHLHARDPRDGRPSADPELFMQFVPAIHDATDAVINITTGGSLTMSVEERLAAPLRLSPEMCSLNMGSMNFGFFAIAEKQTSWKHEWERPYVLGSRSAIFRNTFADIEQIMRELGEGHGTKFEHECYDVGHLYTLAHYVDRGLIKAPFFVQTIFGILGGIGAEADNLVFMRRTADRLFGDDYVWSVMAAGRHQMPMNTQGALMGANVRVGLEDSLFIEHGKLASSNAEQVIKIKAILNSLGLETASPAEAGAALGLKGRANVRF